MIELFFDNRDQVCSLPDLVEETSFVPNSPLKFYWRCTWIAKLSISIISSVFIRYFFTTVAECAYY